MEDIILVVVPIYKVERYLKSCVDSILNQTYKNLQVILVDDGSPDSCPQICDEYAKYDKRVQVIHKENGGLSDARNAGIDSASGKYITFVDSDDFIFPEMIARLYELCEKYQADLSMCQCIHGKDKDFLDFVRGRKDIGEVKEDIFENEEKLRAYLISRKIDIVIWKKLYKMELFQSLRFPKGKLHEDAFVTYILIDNADKVIVTNEVGYFYRKNPQSIMNSGFAVQKFHLIEAKLKQLRYIEEKHPKLRLYACAGVIYACNCCLEGMVLQGYFEKKAEKWIQRLYRKYTFMYIKARNIGIGGKMLALLAFVNTQLARFVFKLFNITADVFTDLFCKI